MPTEVQFWRVKGERLEPLPSGTLDLESRLEDWLANDVSILGTDLLVIGRQVATAYGGFIDLLCIDSSGDLVIVELKRGRTPRDITAQALDYAAWVVDLAAEEVGEMADRYLGSGGPLSEAFRNAFDEDLPDVLNEGHRMLIVGSDIDGASERIIRYLSDRHGVSINAITFRYFRDDDGDELVSRVHLLEPDQVERRAQSKGTSKRRSKLSFEQLEAAAEERGVGELYRFAFESLQPCLDFARTTKSSLRLGANFGRRRGALLNLLPTVAEPNALPFQLYTARAEKRFNLPRAQILQALPVGTEDWEYVAGADDWWRGHEGVLRSAADVESLRRLFEGAVTANGGSAQGSS